MCPMLYTCNYSFPHLYIKLVDCVFWSNLHCCIVSDALAPYHFKMVFQEHLNYLFHFVFSLYFNLSICYFLNLYFFALLTNILVASIVKINSLYNKNQATYDHHFSLLYQNPYTKIAWRQLLCVGIQYKRRPNVIK